MRKNVLEYDNVANDQRKVIYAQRNDLLKAEDVSEILKAMRLDVAESTFHNYIPEQSLEEQWDVSGLTHALESDFGLKLNIKEWLEKDDELHEENLKERIINQVVSSYEEKLQGLDQSSIHQFEKIVLLQSMDTHWREHLNNLDHLRSSIHLRGYAQKDPKQEYKREAFELFSSMLDNFKYDVISTLTKIHIERPEEELNQVEDQWRHSVDNLAFSHDEVNSIAEGPKNAQKESAIVTPISANHAQANAQLGEQEKHQPFVRAEKKVSRNEPCPCGSGKKYKHCHGALK
jgi:preprotein translocase subunit SecA